MNDVVGNLGGRNQRLGRRINLRRSYGGKKDRCEKQSTETSNAHRNHLVRATQPGGPIAKVVRGTYYNRCDKRALQVQINSICDETLLVKVSKTAAAIGLTKTR